MEKVDKTVLAPGEWKVCCEVVSEKYHQATLMKTHQNGFLCLFGRLDMQLLCGQEYCKEMLRVNSKICVSQILCLANYNGQQG